MERDEELFAARIEVLKMIVLIALARDKAEREAGSWLRAAEPMLQSAEFARAIKGLSHKDDRVRMTFEKRILNETPAEAFDLLSMMKDPPGEKGRPKGTGYEEADLALMPEIHRRRTAGETLKSVTEQLAATMNLASTQTEGAAIRLQRRYRQWRRTHKK